MDINALLREEIEHELDELGEMEVGSEQHKTAVDGVTKLVDRVIELDKAEAERDNKLKDRESDLEFRAKQANEERLDRIIKNGIAVASVILPLLVTIWGTRKSIEFEKEGTITTIMGRGFINKLLPKK